MDKLCRYKVDAPCDPPSPLSVTQCDAGQCSHLLKDVAELVVSVLL